MKPFLQQVAAYYANEQALEDLCFVFPNRRSGKFFEQNMAQLVHRPAIMPRVMSMTDFLSDITGHNAVAELEALLVLYKAYRQVMGDEAASMDTFVYWGHLIINDFNDADMNMVDVRQLYSNLRDLRQIATDYLDPELKRDIERVLNIKMLSTDDSQRLWQGPWQGQEGADEVQRSYFTLWERLYQIYQTYHQLLEQSGLRTVGGIYRDAPRCIESIDQYHLPSRVVMVGFTSLSVSEMAVFKTLKNRGLAHFWWDNALDELVHDDNPAGQLVREYVRLFPMPADLELLTLKGKHIEAVAVPSQVGQAKWAFHRIDEMVREKWITDTDNAIDTAIVLPDEGLFVPLVNSVSEHFTNFNVTMGYPLRQSNIVSLMHLVARAHKQATRRVGQWTFYREDVKDIMSHPVIKVAFTQQALKVNERIERLNEWNVPATWLCEVGFETLFQPLDDVTDVQQVMSYIDRLIAFCQKVNQLIIEDTQKVNEDKKEDNDVRLPLQSVFIEQYVDALEQMKNAFTIHGIPVLNDALFYLIDRLTQGVVVPFEGEPLLGLQIMGLQETRSLDFKNIIILSMNERVYPRKHAVASLIPDQLRAAFFMLTSGRQDITAAYDFYRLISRAERVVMLHYVSSGGDEPSRFIQQLKLLHRDKVKFIERRVDAKATLPIIEPIEVNKELIPMYDYVNPSVTEDTEGAHCLSHSSIAEYMECPLKFYFHHVEHLSDDSDATDFMDSGTFGSIVHEILQALYYPIMQDGSRRKDAYIVTRQMIENFIQTQMEKHTKWCINKIYLHHEPEAPLEGEALMMQETIETFVKRAMTYDLRLMEQMGVDQIEVLECEKPHKVQLDFSHDGIQARFNFKYYPDRVDRVAGQLRIVDYKTGQNDMTDFRQLDELFEMSNPNVKRRKAIAQLMLYCNAWQLEHPDDKVIQPMIYKLCDIDETGVFQYVEKASEKGKKPKTVKGSFMFELDSDFNRQFKSRMGDIVARLLDQKQPFTQADQGSKCCGYCRFTEFCSR